MREDIVTKVREAFAAMSILKDSVRTNSIFAGRNLPSFVKDYLLKRHLDLQTGDIDTLGLSRFLDKAIPAQTAAVKDRILSGEEVSLLCRFSVYIDLVKGQKQFAIPDYGVKLAEGIIPEYTYRQHQGELGDGEKWSIVKLCLLPDEGGTRNHVQMVDYKPFKPYSAVDVDYWCEARRGFTTDEWVDFLISAMEYDPDGFESTTQKVEFLTRLLIFVEPRLNVVELAPKGTGKSYVFGNLSKYGWLVSGGKVTRAKLFYDKARQQSGMIKNHDFVVFDEIQTIKFQEPAEIQAALKSYLESGKTTIDNNEFSSECGLMLMGNIPLTSQRTPVSHLYFNSLPNSFQDSALLDRFHCFIKGWLLPRVNSSMMYRGWTINVEYFSEILHALRTVNTFGLLFDDVAKFEERADVRDSKAIKRVATAYMKLLFPHWRTPSEVDRDEFRRFCLEPARMRRGVIKEQCRNLDSEFNSEMPDVALV